MVREGNGMERTIRPRLMTPLGRGSKYRFQDMVEAAAALVSWSDDQDRSDPMKITFEIDPNEVAQMYGGKAEAIKNLLRGAGVYFSAQEDPRNPGIWVINM